MQLREHLEAECKESESKRQALLEQNAELSEKILGFEESVRVLEHKLSNKPVMVSDNP